MENKREEQLFRQEAERESRETANIDDAKLMRAIRSGVKRGSASSGRRLYRYVGAGAAGLALAAGVFMATNGYLRHTAVVEAPAIIQSSGNEASWGEYENFRSSVSGEPILEDALSRGAVEPLKIKAEAGGYELELYGAVGDSRKLTLLYAIGGEGVRSTALSQGLLIDASGAVIGTQESRRDFYKDGHLYGYATFALEQSPQEEQETSALKFKLEAPVYSRTPNPGYDKDSEKLAVLTANVELNRKSAAGGIGSFERELADRQTLTVDGQVLHIEQALITPQRGYVVLVPDPNNDKNISRLVGARLTVTKDGKKTVSEGGPGVGIVLTEKDGSKRFEFTFNRVPLPKNPDSVTFGVDGIEALSREEQKLIIDTDAHKVIQAPDPQISAKLEPAADGTETLKVNYPIDSERVFGGDPPSMMNLDLSFTDAKGKKYPLSYPVSEDGMTVIGEVEPGSTSTFASYVMEKRDYAQPLTFKILAYPREIIEPHSIELKDTETGITDKK